MADAAVITAGAAVASALAAGYSAVSQNQAQGKSRVMQRQAQETASANARRQQMLSQENIAAQNKKQPDVAALLAALGGNGLQPPSTLLTGGQGATTKLGQ